MRKTHLAALVALAALARPAMAETVQWASKIADPGNTNSAAVTGAPDGVATSITFYSAAYVRDFQPGRASMAQMERMLKLPAGELARWDVIAIESKAIAPGETGFDSSMWMVNDMQKLKSAVYDGSTKASVPGTGEGWTFRTGMIAKADFKALFPGPRVFADSAYILIKLPAGIDKRSPNLAVWLSGGPMGVSSSDPAPDAIGVIR
mgnify:CR=1 FL=1